jgi:formylmethanofuran dehydrogenase subunit D
LTEQEQEEIKIELVVKESPIEAKDGVARINEAVLKQLGVEEGHSVVTTAGEKSLLLTVFADNLIEKNMISIRPGDLERLGIGTGDKVQLEPHKTVAEVLSEKTEALKEKLEIGENEEEKQDE